MLFNLNLLPGERHEAKYDSQVRQMINLHDTTAHSKEWDTEEHIGI